MKKTNLLFLLTSYFILQTSMLACQTQRYNEPVDYSVKLDSSFSKPIDKGLLNTKEVLEASGLAYSKQNQILWTHNDSGGDNRLFVLNEKGEELGYYVLEGLKACDWEDISISTNPTTNKPHIFVAETGNNTSECQAMEYKIIYRIEEPQFTPKKTNNPFVRSIGRPKIEPLRFVYPDEFKDVETLMIDHATQDIYLVSKRDKQVEVYRFPYPQSTKNITKIEKVATLHFTKAIAGSISLDGTEILIKNYANVYYWKRNLNESISETLKRKPARLPYEKEPQGESIAWKSDGSGYYTLSEYSEDEVPQHLYFYSRIKLKERE